MPKRDKYVPKHRDLPAPSPLRKSIRTAAVATGVAAAATGVTVAAGVVHTDRVTLSTASAADLDGSRAVQKSAAKLTADELVKREASYSRSSEDRRSSEDKTKAAALSTRAGVAKTQVEKINDTDPKQLTRALMPEFGLSASEFGCLDRIWTQESGWNVHADNPSSSAYGIPQALPGSKMSSAGPDWANNAETQIRWGLGYIKSRYGSACSAWGFKSGHGWY